MALALALIGFVALVVFGFGMTSLATSTEPISTPGLGPLPGVIGVAAAGVAIAVVMYPVVRSAQPRYLPALGAAIAAYLAYLAGVGLTAVLGGADVAVATGVVGGLAIGWWAPIVAASAFVCAWAAVALRRTRAERPRWPWEDEDQ